MSYTGRTTFHAELPLRNTDTVPTTTPGDSSFRPSNARRRLAGSGLQRREHTSHVSGRAVLRPSLPYSGGSASATRRPPLCGGSGVRRRRRQETRLTDSAISRIKQELMQCFDDGRQNCEVIFPTSYLPRTAALRASLSGQPAWVRTQSRAGCPRLNLKGIQQVTGRVMRGSREPWETISTEPIMPKTILKESLTGTQSIPVQYVR